MKASSRAQQPAGHVGAWHEELGDAGELVRPLAVPPHDLRAVGIGGRAAGQLGDPLGVLAHAHDLRLAAGVQPGVVHGGRAEAVVDGACGHLATEGDPGHVGAPVGLVSAPADRAVGRALDLGQVLLDQAGLRVGEGDLLERLTEHLAGLVDDGALVPRVPRSQPTNTGMVSPFPSVPSMKVADVDQGLQRPARPGRQQGGRGAGQRRSAGSRPRSTRPAAARSSARR